MGSLAESSPDSPVVTVPSSSIDEHHSLPPPPPPSPQLDRLPDEYGHVMKPPMKNMHSSLCVLAKRH